MKYILLIVIFLSSCFESPIKEDGQDDNTTLDVYWLKEYSIGNSIAKLTAINDRIIFSGDLSIVQVNESTGEEIWKREIDGQFSLFGRRIFADENYVVAGHRESILCWSTDNGELIWEYKYPDDLRAGLNGNITRTDNEYIFNAFNNQIFKLDYDGQLTLRKQFDIEYGAAGVTYDDEKIFVAQSNTIHGGLTLGRVSAIDANSGDSLWTFDTDRGAPQNMQPLVKDEILYVVGLGNSPTLSTFALDTNTGEIIWEKENLYGYEGYIGPNNLYVNANNHLYAIGLNDGEIKWQVPFYSSSSRTNMVYLEGYVYHVRFNEIVIIDDKSGKVVHREPPPSSFFSSIIVANNKIFTQTDNEVIAFKPWHLMGE